MKRRISVPDASARRAMCGWGRDRDLVGGDELIALRRMISVEVRLRLRQREDSGDA